MIVFNRTVYQLTKVVTFSSIDKSSTPAEAPRLRLRCRIAALRKWREWLAPHTNWCGNKRIFRIALLLRFQGPTTPTLTTTAMAPKETKKDDKKGKCRLTICYPELPSTT